MKIRLIPFALSAILAVTACSNSTSTESAKTETAKPKDKYYCTMHPDITSDKPGTCSKCGMDLAERDTTAK